MANLISIFDEILKKEQERNEILNEVGLAGFSLSDEEVFKHAVDAFVLKVQEKAVEAVNGRTP